MELYNYCMAQPEIPDVAMAFSNPNVTAYIDGSEQRTEEIKFKAEYPAEHYHEASGRCGIS